MKNKRKNEQTMKGDGGGQECVGWRADRAIQKCEERSSITAGRKQPKHSVSDKARAVLEKCKF